MFSGNNIPERYRCPITKQIMIDPVFTANGHTYEREAIAQCLQTRDKDPITNLRLKHKELTDNHDKRGEILEFLDNHPELYDGNEVYLPQSWVTQCVMAIKNNQCLEVRRWIDKDRRLLTLELKGNSTALHLACEFSSPELVDILLKILKQRNRLITLSGVGFKKIHLNALLQNALNKGDYSDCELLLKLGAEVEQPEASHQNTLLHRMVVKGNLDAVDWLLEQKAFLENRNEEGDTPLLLSVKQGYANITAFLLKAKANPEAKNAQQKTAFYVAVEKGYREIAALLLEYGAKPTVKCGATQLSALHVAVQNGDAIMLQYLLQTQAAVLIDAQNARGDTPLHLAVQSGHDALILVLLKSGAYYKIKNERGQTPVELAKVQQKRKTADFIVQINRELKKAKLKETDKLRQVVSEQANEIAHLKTALLQIQSAMPAASTSSNPKNPLVFSPLVAPPCVCFPANAEPILNVNPVEEFLRFVAQGEQDKAEAMLKNDRTLALRPGDVTDLSKRTFKSITGFQYAVWALDWHMWTMIQKYLPLEAARTQAQAFETGAWIREQGVHAEWLLGKLINAYQTTLNLYEQSKWVEGDVAWVEQVGGAQRLLPAHVVNEYCHPTRAFYPLPDFKAALSLPRNRIIDQGEWFTASFDGGLGNKFAVYRGTAYNRAHASLPRSGDKFFASLRLGWSRHDQASIHRLTNTRIAQRETIITELGFVAQNSQPSSTSSLITQRH